MEKNCNFHLTSLCLACAIGAHGVQCTFTVALSLKRKQCTCAHVRQLYVLLNDVTVEQSWCATKTSETRREKLKRHQQLFTPQHYEPCPFTTCFLFARCCVLSAQFKFIEYAKAENMVMTST